MGVVPPPDHLHTDQRGVTQRPEDDAVPPVLGRRAFGRDPHAAAGRDDREPVIDVARVLDVGLRIGWPQVRGGGSGAAVDAVSVSAGGRDSVRRAEVSAEGAAAG
jgi:hypothetical protein